MFSVKARRGRRARLGAFTTRTKLVYKVRARAYISSPHPPHHMQSSPDVALTNEHKILFFFLFKTLINQEITVNLKKQPSNPRASPSHQPISKLQTRQHNQLHQPSFHPREHSTLHPLHNKQSQHTATEECAAHKVNPTNPLQQPTRNYHPAKKNGSPLPTSNSNRRSNAPRKRRKKLPPRSRGPASPHRQIGAKRWRRR